MGKTWCLAGAFLVGCAVFATGRTLVLVELKGGNDGLNTVVPYSDPAYDRLRPTTAVSSKDVLALGQDLGLNPACRSLLSVWEAGELAILLGLGYPTPNRSHFRSIDIWNTASDSDQVLRTGWIARALSAAGDSGQRTADSLVLGRSDVGPLVGPGMRNIVLRDPRAFLEAAGLMGVPSSAVPDNQALGHILTVQRDTVRAADELKNVLARASELATVFPKTSLGRQLQTAAILLGGGLEVPVIKVTLGGFDTHANQRAVHDQLLRQMADALAAFRLAAREIRMWDELLVVTYSEFGRRPTENGSKGTDHGTASAHFALGGRVEGGFYGDQPSLTDLLADDLRYTVDFRSLYATIINRWWGLSSNILDGRSFPPIAFLP